MIRGEEVEGEKDPHIDRLYPSQLLILTLSTILLLSPVICGLLLLYVCYVTRCRLGARIDLWYTWRERDGGSPQTDYVRPANSISRSH